MRYPGVSSYFFDSPHRGLTLTHRFCQPRTLEIERFLGGIDEEVTATGYEIAMMHIFSPMDPRTVLKTVPFREYTEPTPSTPEVRHNIFSCITHKISDKLTTDPHYHPCAMEASVHSPEAR